MKATSSTANSEDNTSARETSSISSRVGKMHSHFSRALWGPGPIHYHITQCAQSHSLSHWGSELIAEQQGNGAGITNDVRLLLQTMWLFIFTFEASGVKEETPDSLSFSNHHVPLAKSKVGKRAPCRSH